MLYRMKKKIFQKNVVEGKKSRMDVEEVENLENQEEVFLKIWPFGIGLLRKLEYLGTKKTDNRKLFSRFCRAEHGLSPCVFIFLFMMFKEIFLRKKEIF